MLIRIVLVLGLALFLTTPLHALELPRLIGSGMVVQRGEAIPVWGRAEAGSEITVQFRQQTRSTRANEEGFWQIAFPKLSAGGPYQLSVQGDGERRNFFDIWVGDVWVCSGQSNMEWPLRETEDAANVIANTNDKHIRHFKIPKSWASKPETSLAGGGWQPATKHDVGNFSAVAYYFAKHIREEVDVPIGLINSTWGGSNIESWMDAPLLGLDPEENFQKLDALRKQEAVEAKKTKQTIARWPGALSNDYTSANANWSAADLDEQDWIKIQAPAFWEQQQFNGLDGVAWYRKDFTLTKKQSQQDLELGLARVDDHDITWVNGHQVGETKIYNHLRKYTVDKKFLQPGKNTIAVRVLDTGGGGGIWGDTKNLYLRGSGVAIDLSGEWRFKVDKGMVMMFSDRNLTPTALYNKMLHPLFHVPVKGVIWYQGESNAFAAEQAFDYREQFKKLIQDWRSKWNKESLPFYWVQLANFISGVESEHASPWAILRESQTEALQLPHTGQAVIVDVGNPHDIHPRDKKTVGYRLALHALKNDYGIDNIVASSPQFASAKVEGETVIVHLQAGATLTVAGGQAVKGFEIRSENGQWYPAAAELQGQELIVRSDKVQTPTGVRYAWSDNPQAANLQDQSGLPATPFRQLQLQQ